MKTIKLCVSSNPMRSTDALDHRYSSDFGPKHTIYIRTSILPNAFEPKNTRIL